MDDIKHIMTDAAGNKSGVATATQPEGFVVRCVPAPGASVWCVCLVPSMPASLFFPFSCCSVERAYPADEFGRTMAKFVRAGHLQTDDSWRRTWKKAVLHAHTKAGKK